jgi:hypothetical protein
VDDSVDNAIFSWILGAGAYPKNMSEPLRTQEYCAMSERTPLAYGIDELPFGRTKAYAEIAAGRLQAVKLGTRTLVLADELRRYLASLPAATIDTMRAVTEEQRSR